MPEPSAPKTVLVLEDHPLNMRLAADLLKVNGYRVLEAVDGASALRLLATTVPALILMDIRLPDINGFDVFRRIQADPRLAGVKVAALTASVMPEEEGPLRALFHAYIPKPIDTKRFIEQVKALAG